MNWNKNTDRMFGHSYGYPSEEGLWQFEDWLTVDEEIYRLSGREEQITYEIDWKGKLPYPEGDISTK